MIDTENTLLNDLTAPVNLTLDHPASNDPSDYESLLLTAPTTKMKIEFRDIVYKVTIKGKKKVILDDVNGIIMPGELTAIMGPSGAGKSTLLNVLAGYRTGVSSGYISVNDELRNDESFRKCSAYIMQDDVMLPNLTVLESMMVSANLRLHSVSEAHVNKKQRVIEILKTLGLEDIAHSNVSDVSGGQKKRISIALELVSNPPVIFLDEPTSGLDSHSAFQCINLMRALVKQGRTICCTIHQPSARLFELFDKVIVLANGSVLYSGVIGDMVPYFSQLNIVCPRYHNPADFILEVASGYYGQKVENLCIEWKKKREVESEDSTVSQEPSVTIRGSGKNIFKSSRFLSKSSRSSSSAIYHSPIQLKTLLFHEIIQFVILTKRSMRASSRDKMFTYLRLASTVLMALLLGSLYYNIGHDGSNVPYNLGCIFFTMIYLIFISLMPTVLTFPIEKNVFIREHLNNWYTLKAYYLSKTFSDMPFQIFLPIIYCIIMYYMSGQPLQFFRLFRFVFVVVMSVLVSQSIGLLLGALAPNTSVAVFVAPVSGIPLLLFCGYFVKFKVIPVYLRWITYISYARYCWEGAVLSLYGSDRGSLTCLPDTACMFHNGKEVLEYLDITEDAVGLEKFRIWFCIIILSIIFVGLRLLAYLVLRYAISNNKK